MREWLGSGILGSIFGGIFRMLPEVLNYFDKKNERAHELAMFEKQMDMERQRGEFAVEKRYVDHSVAQLGAIQEAFKEQGAAVAAAASAGYGWVAAAAAMVRPAVTYILFGVYVVVKASIVIYAFMSHAPWIDIVKQHWSTDDFAMLNMILTFWFVGRAIEKYRVPT